MRTDFSSDRRVLSFDEVDRTSVDAVGGKGANLGELSRIDGLHVPPGFCVTTEAFVQALADTLAVGEQLERLAGVDPGDREVIRTLSAELRQAVEAVAVPADLAAAITDAIGRLGERRACAVRSSATAEDLPTTSFAGQQDTYLNVVGATEVVGHISRCWASLFTERAVIYRHQHGIDHRAVRMAVVVQQMVVPEAAGIMFTADPITSNRTVVSIEAGFGLGEALVSGLVNADSYQVRGGEIVARAIAIKQLAIEAAAGGGTQEREIEPERQGVPALTDEQVVQLAALGRRIEAHFGCPQDVEWCLADGAFHIVQSRPITTLFPIPAADDGGNHVYISVGHQQMMTDAMKPLGLSVWRLTARPPMHEAGGRLFVDVTQALASPSTRDAMLAVWSADPLIGDALRSVAERDGFLPVVPEAGPAGSPGPPPGGAPAPIETDPAIVDELMAQNRASVAALEHDLEDVSGEALLDVILDDIAEMKRLLFDPRSHQVFMGAMDASQWLNEHLELWLGETNVADTLTQSVPNNVTSEMGMALLDVADVIRPHPEVVAFLREVDDDGFLDELPGVEGGQAARDAISTYLDEYGMRCVGEIDITRPRWSERPSALLPMILGNVAQFGPGAAERRFEQGRREAEEKEREVLERLAALPDGEQKAAETKRMIDRVRTFIGYREYPKFGIVRRYFVYKQALLREADRLVRAGVLREPEDIYYLSLEELHEVVRTGRVDDGLIAERKDSFESSRRLTPPRVLTSDGERVAGVYRRDGVPAGALVGLAVSSGVVEGRARVIHDLADADLEAGDILVTAFTDPSWAPAFVAVAGLVTEVGGLMTHGAVIAREYGLPAVVGVEDATRRIRDGQRIRVDGTRGHVELLPAAAKV